MSHRRNRIRDHAVGLLGGVASTVTTSRLHNWQPAELPAVAVFTLDETGEPASLARTQERKLRLIVDIHVRSEGGDVDDDLDDLCVAAEKAMAADWRMGDLALGGDLVETTIGFSGEGEARHGLARLVYRIVYRTDPAQPDS